MKRRNIIRIIVMALLVIALAIIGMFFTGCESEASSVNHNLNVQSQYFECERRITVYNARTDKIILEVEGYMDISNNLSGELVVTCKVGENKYKRNYVYLNEYTLYVVEDITGTHTDPWHYKVYFHKPILPDVEVVQ